SSWKYDLSLPVSGSSAITEVVYRLSPGRAPFVFHSAPPQSYSGAGFAVPQYTVLVFGSYPPAIQPPPPPVFHESPPHVFIAGSFASLPPTVKNVHASLPVFASTPNIGP